MGGCLTGFWLRNAAFSLEQGNWRVMGWTQISWLDTWLCWDWGASRGKQIWLSQWIVIWWFLTAHWFFHSYNHHLATTFSILRSNLTSHLALLLFWAKAKTEGWRGAEEEGWRSVATTQPSKSPWPFVGNYIPSAINQNRTHPGFPSQQNKLRCWRWR